jgi:hypothetical protein
MNDHLANARADAFIYQTMKEKNIPGLSPAVVENGKTVLGKGYGFSNLEHYIPASEQTVYCIGSITKIFTASSGINSLYCTLFITADSLWSQTVRCILFVYRNKFHIKNKRRIRAYITACPACAIGQI